jgi:cyclophilin family peptidyl-prolyl cis-trans isomerase
MLRSACLVAGILVAGLCRSGTAQVPAPPPNPTAVISTSSGDFTIELFRDRAPVSVANFIQYATERFYEGTIFHRVVRGMVIQGGGFDATLREKPTRPPILNEATNGLRNVRGSVGMARTASLRSATSQFYVNVADNPQFDHRGFTPSDYGYAVFGRVIAGMAVVDQIAATSIRNAAGMDEVPVEPIVIKSVTVKGEGVKGEE